MANLTEVTHQWLDGLISDSELLEQALSYLILATEAIELVKISIQDREPKPEEGP